MIDDTFTMNTDPVRLRQLLTRLRARLISQLAHEEAGALPLMGQIMASSELGGIARAISGMGGRLAGESPWRKGGANP